MHLDGNVALITGASRGIGRGIAKVLATQGMRLALNYHREHGAAMETLEAVQEVGAEAITVRADVSDQGQVTSMVATVLERFGQLDLLVNNAGIDSAHAPEELPLAEWERVLAVNLTGAFLCSQAALTPMRTQGRGRIVMIASIASLRGAGNVHYVASKAGMLRLTMPLAPGTSTPPPVRGARSRSKARPAATRSG